MTASSTKRFTKPVCPLTSEAFPGKGKGVDVKTWLPGKVRKPARLQAAMAGPLLYVLIFSALIVKRKLPVLANFN